MAPVRYSYLFVQTDVWREKIIDIKQYVTPYHILYSSFLVSLQLTTYSSNHD